MTKTKLAREVGKLNDLLGQELGRNPFGEPHYAWKWSEDLLHPMAVTEEGDDGRMRPVLDYVADPQSGLLVARQKFVLRKECPTLQDQWVLCKWQPPIDPTEWRKLFGHSLEWSGRGDYAPISASGSGNYASLDPGERPTDRTTWQAIHVVKLNRSVSQRDRDYEFERERERREQKVREDIQRDVRESGMVAGRPWLRGKGNQDYSFGGLANANGTEKETTNAGN